MSTERTSLHKTADITVKVASAKCGNSIKKNSFQFPIYLHLTKHFKILFSKKRDLVKIIKTIYIYIRTITASKRFYELAFKYP